MQRIDLWLFLYWCLLLVKINFPLYHFINSSYAYVFYARVYIFVVCTIVYLPKHKLKFTCSLHYFVDEIPLTIFSLYIYISTWCFGYMEVFLWNIWYELCCKQLGLDLLWGIKFINHGIAIKMVCFPSSPFFSLSAYMRERGYIIDLC